MRPRNSSSKTLLAGLLVCVVVAMARPAAARDHEFGRLVHQIESQYHARRQHRILLGFASGLGNVVITFWRPYGVRNFKLALFNEQDLVAGSHDRDFAAAVRAAVQLGWHPVVTAWSRKDGERTYIFVRDAGKNVKFLIATVDQEDAAVIQVALNPHKLARSIAKEEGKPCGRHDDHDPQQENAPSDAFTALLAQRGTAGVLPVGR
ncbi:MAG TPA: hypothetical protein VJV74_02800 [Terriglobia bacterium]|nr:hypothetical protein [Terriglobia bacterium]